MQTLMMRGHGSTLYVSNLPLTYEDEDVEALFTACPDMNRATVKRDRYGKSMGCALVIFENAESAKYAAAMKNGWMVENKSLYARLFLRNTADDGRPYHQTRERHPRVYQERSYQAIPGVIGYQAHRLTLEALAAASPNQQKSMLAEKLYGPVEQWCTSKMEAQSVMQHMMKMDNRALLGLVENAELVRGKINEARDYIAGSKPVPNAPGTSTPAQQAAPAPAQQAAPAPVPKSGTLVKRPGAVPAPVPKSGPIVHRYIPSPEPVPKAGAASKAGASQKSGAASKAGAAQKSGAAQKATSAKKSGAAQKPAATAANQQPTTSQPDLLRFLSHQRIIGASPQEQIDMLAERILPWVEMWQPGNPHNRIITSGLLEMDHFDLFALIQDHTAFRQKVDDLAKIIADLQSAT